MKNECKARRDLLLERLAKVQSLSDDSLILLSSNFELSSVAYRQDPTFWYYLGCNEPGAFATIAPDGYTTLYIPDTGGSRAQWLPGAVDKSEAWKMQLGVDHIEYLGKPIKGYTMSPFFSAEEASHLLNRLTDVVEAGGFIYTPSPEKGLHYLQPRMALSRLGAFVEGLSRILVDISSFIAVQRRKKSAFEIERLYKAVDVTMVAHFAASQLIRPNATEREVQAIVEYQMIAAGAERAFESIVASGKNATVLHYKSSQGHLAGGDMLVLDIGAIVDGYCADISRTYPVSGTMSERQLSLYTMVLEAQQFIADMARPGMYLRNQEHQDQSLHHLCIGYFKDLGMDSYFQHSVGHYLGLDVHDVGDYATPLEEGDVITIEPGLYLPQEGIGIRIEDDYWITESGAVCLSEELPKEASDIELMMQEGAPNTLF